AGRGHRRPPGRPSPRRQRRPRRLRHRRHPRRGDDAAAAWAVSGVGYLLPSRREPDDGRHPGDGAALYPEALSRKHSRERETLMNRRTHLTIGTREIGPGSPCFVIAEAGINHNGDVTLASE